MGIWGVLSPEQMTSAAVGFTQFSITGASWYWLLLCTGFVILSAYLALGPYGKVKLGAADEEPEFSTPSWIAMLFAGGMGAGLLFWGVAEPVTHFSSPPGMTGGTAAAAREAMDRYGLAFASVDLIPGSDHSLLYKRLLDGAADVVVGFASDSQISDFGLRVLDDDAGFFPTYAAMPLVAASAPAGVTKALAQLAGKIDAPRMARLNAEVEIGYRDPRKVAIAELAELGLIDPGIIEGAPPLSIAVNQSEIGGAMANTVLQAARDAAPGRNVVLEGNPRPVSRVIEGSSRAALAPSIAQFEITSRGATLREDIETIAAVGSYYLHAFARTDGPDRLQDAATIATGPPGTPSEKLGRIVARSEGAEIRTLAGADAEAAIAALQSDQADAAVVIAPPGLGDIEAALLRTDGVRLIKADGWWRGSTKLGHPFLRAASLTAGTSAQPARRRQHPGDAGDCCRSRPAA